MVNTGGAIATTVREFGIDEASLGRWVSAFKARNDTGETGVTESERAELLRLRKENADLKLIPAFLEKASIFSSSAITKGLQPSTAAFRARVWPAL